MAVRWLISGGGNFSSTSVWNDGTLLGIPTTGDDVFTNGFTVNMDTNATVNSLNNTARARDIATPQMTSNSSPSPFVIFASSTAGGNNEPWRAFDRNITPATLVGWSAASGQLTGSIGADFGSGNSVVIDAYDIVGYNQSVYNPRNWTLEGSNDSITWTVLHTVTQPAPIGASATYSVGSIGNTTAYRYYRINITLNGGTAPLFLTEILFYQPGTAALAAGGSFNFNTAGVTVSATSTSASLSAGATNLITVTATTGTVTLSLGSAVSYNIGVTGTLINNTGNCNFNLNGIRFTGGGAFTNTFCINKSSTGTITITGDLVGGTGGTTPHAFNSTAGNTIVIGNVFGSSTGFGISQTAGNVTVTGNVTGGTATSVHGISLTGAASQFTINGDVRGGSGSSAHGINFGGTLGTVNGNVTGGGGSGARGIEATVGGVNVNGNVFGNISVGLNIGASSTITGNIFAGSGAGVFTSTNNSLTVTVIGDVYASTINNGIALTGTGTQVVNLTGNMYNTLGRSAIWCPNVFISNTATTLWRMDTGGGNYKFLYSADSTTNLPATTNVRNGVTFGPALSLTGTMVVPSASDVRENVPVDNTVGTGELTSADIISGINASSDPLAVRLKNTLTDTTAGNIISQYNNS
jgi:hypothetical protein